MKTKEEIKQEIRDIADKWCSMSLNKDYGTTTQAIDQARIRTLKWVLKEVE